jgi:hypothetical protein
MLKYTDDKTISETDRKSKDQIRSMKNILDIKDVPKSHNNNRS